MREAVILVAVALARVLVNDAQVLVPVRPVHLVHPGGDAAGRGQGAPTETAPFPTPTPQPAALLQPPELTRLIFILAKYLSHAICPFNHF